MPPDGNTAFLPEKQGFDVNKAGTFRGSPPSYFSPYKIETLEDGPAGEYLTDREQAEASEFIRQHRDEAFLVYLPHHTVHTPLQAQQQVIEKYKRLADDKSPQHNPTYAAMIESLDENIGKLMRTLEDNKIADRTVVIVTGDNGGWLASTNTNLGLRAGKGSVYEGGVRVPLIIRWPGVVRPGSMSDTPVIGCDLYPTILEMAKAKTEAGQVIDGHSIVPLLRNAGDWKRDALFWHYPHYHPGGARPYSAVRLGDWKLIRFYEDDRAELYNLLKDPAEQSDLAGSNPAKVAELRRRLEAWLESVAAQRPVANPGFDPTRAHLTAAQAKTRELRR
jgi:arylsulfatase A-like enzyme